MTMTSIILLALFLFFIQLLLQLLLQYNFNIRQMMSNREILPKESAVAARLVRAKNNMLETLPLFIGVALLALTKEGDVGAATSGALLYLIARVVYLFVYAAGIPVLRTLIWFTSMVGIFWMAWPLF